MANRVLIVDDEPFHRQLLMEMLALDGLEVRCATNGREAEDELAAEAPDLVLLDVNLPYKSGFELCNLIKQNAVMRLVPVVMVTGLSDTQDRIRAIEAGADDFLSKPVERFELRARVRSLLQRKEHTDELERADEVLMALACSIEAKDPYTEGHCRRISDYSVAMGNELGFAPDEIRALQVAGAVHDIGKVVVPDAILLKEGPLLSDEWDVMRTHTIIGEKICRPLRSFQKVLPIIRSHHERQDGSGYPDRLAGEEVPVLARVMQIADVYDALTTDRPYRKALQCAEALGQMQDEVDRGWWDPELFTVFSQLALQQWTNPHPGTPCDT